MIKVTDYPPKLELELTEVEALDLITELSRRLASMRSASLPVQALTVAALSTFGPKPAACTVKFVLKKSL